MTSPSTKLTTIKAMVGHVRTHGTATHADLLTVYLTTSGRPDVPKNRHRFSQILYYMVEKEYLTSTGRVTDRVFSLGPAVANVKATTAAPVAQPPQPYLQMSRLLANVLPARSPALRPGALDFKCVASRGFAC